MKRTFAAGAKPGDLPDHDVLDEYEAATYLRVCDKTLRKIRKQNLIPFALVGTRIVYVKTQLTQWLSEGGCLQKKAG